MTAILNKNSARLLQAVFGVWWPEAWVCWKSNMKGKRVRNLKPGDLPDDEDCYFCIALLKQGALARTAENAKTVHAIVLDDVGTKLDKDAIDLFCPLEPSWVIETSPGNHHYGFIIRDGLSKGAYREMRTAMASNPIWGHSDNALDPVHLYRLPQGTNTKHGWKVS